MHSVLDIIAAETGGKSYKTYKYSFDGIEVPRFDYDDHQQKFTWKKYGETEYHTKYIHLKSLADKLCSNKPIFRYFLDGSRRVYKIDDISYGNQIYPIIAGQIGVGCCVRENGEMKPFYHNNVPFFYRDIIITLPQKAKISDWDSDDLAFEHIRTKINENILLKNKNIEISKIQSYSTKVDIGEKIENKGIAKIQDYMIDREKYMVAELVRYNKLKSDAYLLKDGSLEYQVHGIGKNKIDLKRFKNNYQFVVGVSKSFNPAYCVDKNGINNSNMIAELPLYHRTPVQMYDSPRIGDMNFAVWFLRIRDSKYTNNTFDGILKIEKILVNDDENENGLNTEEVDMITANIINERNPVCYGADSRWANHLYPVYVTEKYIKSKYLGESMFLNLF